MQNKNLGILGRPLVSAALAVATVSATFAEEEDVGEEVIRARLS